jgi:hypothetical protein
MLDDDDETATLTADCESILTYAGTHNAATKPPIYGDNHTYVV